jgi:hypothetical protein
VGARGEAAPRACRDRPLSELSLLLAAGAFGRLLPSAGRVLVSVLSREGEAGGVRASPPDLRPRMQEATRAGAPRLAAALRVRPLGGGEHTLFLDALRRKGGDMARGKRRRPIRRKTRSRLADQVPRRRRPTSDGNPQSEGCAAWRLDPAGGSARARRQTRRGRKQPVEETGPGLVRSVRAAVRDRCPAAAQPETVDADRLHGDAAAASGSVLRADGAGRDRARRRRRVHRQQDRPAEPEDDQQTTSACSG